MPVPELIMSESEKKEEKIEEPNMKIEMPETPPKPEEKEAEPAQ